MEVHYKIDHPLLGIDTRYYNTGLTSKYLAAFIQELTTRSDPKGRLLHFKRGVLTGSLNTIEKL